MRSALGLILEACFFTVALTLQSASKQEFQVLASDTAFVNLTRRREQLDRLKTTAATAASAAKQQRRAAHGGATEGEKKLAHESNVKNTTSSAEPLAAAAAKAGRASAEAKASNAVLPEDARSSSINRSGSSREEASENGASSLAALDARDRHGSRRSQLPGLLAPAAAPAATDAMVDPVQMVEHMSRGAWPFDALAGARAARFGPARDGAGLSQMSQPEEEQEGVQEEATAEGRPPEATDEEIAEETLGAILPPEGPGISEAPVNSLGERTPEEIGAQEKEYEKQADALAVNSVDEVVENAKGDPMLVEDAAKQKEAEEKQALEEVDRAKEEKEAAAKKVTAKMAEAAEYATVSKKLKAAASEELQRYKDVLEKEGEAAETNEEEILSKLAAEEPLSEDAKKEGDKEAEENAAESAAELAKENGADPDVAAAAAVESVRGKLEPGGASPWLAAGALAGREKSDVLGADVAKNAAAGRFRSVATLPVALTASLVAMAKHL